MSQDYLSRKICTTGPALVDYLVSKSDEDYQKMARLRNQKEFYFAVLMMYQSVEKLIKAVYVSRGNHKAPLISSLIKGAEMAEINLNELEQSLIERFDEFNKNKNQENYKSQIDENWLVNIEEQFIALRLKLLDIIN